MFSAGERGEEDDRGEGIRVGVSPRFLRMFKDGTVNSSRGVVAKSRAETFKSSWWESARSCRRVEDLRPRSEEVSIWDALLVNGLPPPPVVPSAISKSQP